MDKITVTLPKIKNGIYVDLFEIGLHDYKDHLPKVGDVFIVTEILPKTVMSEIRLIRCVRHPMQRGTDDV